MSIAKNYIYNVIYQIATLIIPLITVPYISRVLGSKGIGINAYTNSITQNFILFGTIGITLYGNRSIAYVRDNKFDLSKTFWGIFILKLITTFIAYCCFVLFIHSYSGFHVIFLIQSILIFAAAIDISWLYMGLEDFRKIVMRNLIVKAVGVICIFVFVKTTDDLWKYVLLLALSQFLGNLTLWFYIAKTVNTISLKWIDIKKHFMPSLSLFVPQIAIQIYLVLNKIMLGSLSNADEVGFFDNAEKVTKMVLAIVTALGVVMLPRISNTFAKGDLTKVKNYIYQSFDFVSYLSIPLMFGLAGIANELTPWFFGPGFSKTGVLIFVISPIIVFIAWTTVLGQQYLLPTGKIKGYTVSVCIGAIVNFILNFLLIKNYQSVGTAYSTLLAELIVTFVQLYWIRNDIDVRKLFIPIWKYIISGLFMYILIRYIGNHFNANFITTGFQIVTGALLYFILLFIFKSKINDMIFSFMWGKIYRILKFNKNG